ncbi:DEAD/DEAH box helicase family protein [Pseudomonadota bacterium]
MFFETENVAAIWDVYPVSPGHALLIPKQHVSTWFEASEEIRRSMMSSIDIVKLEIEKEHHPDGYNIGFNVGPAAGQTVDHLHVHIIPRYIGDMDDPRGGVRHVIPEKGNYLIREAAAQYELLKDDVVHLTTGASQPLLPMLKADIDRAAKVDIAVAFTLQSGLNLLYEHLFDLLNKRKPKGGLRFLTGDYLDVTDPVALRRLLDLGGEVEVRIYQTAGNTGFHPKAYLCHFDDGYGVAYIGSSNISEPALTTSVEWNYRIIDAQNPEGFGAAQVAFDALFADSNSIVLTNDWIDVYDQRRSMSKLLAKPLEVAPEPTQEVPEPHEVQVHALEALEQSRQLGNSAGLVVLATGLGKTWLSAFDSNREEFNRILFVAHREEILGQALKTFRKIRPNERISRYTGQEKDTEAEILFASIQTLSRLQHLQKFDRREFDYIVVDEFHHAAAATYRKLINYFEPKFLLGLTATPERMDGGDLLGLCQENLVFRYDLVEGINSELLCPFHYFGVPDGVDYKNITWRGSRFDPEELTAAVATQERAANALDQYRKRGGEKTIAFCCSQLHADFMADYFNEKGTRVHY